MFSIKTLSGCLFVSVTYMRITFLFVILKSSRVLIGYLKSHNAFMSSVLLKDYLLFCIIILLFIFSNRKFVKSLNNKTLYHVLKLDIVQSLRAIWCVTKPIFTRSNNPKQRLNIRFDHLFIQFVW